MLALKGIISLEPMISGQKELKYKAKTACVQLLRDFCFVGTVFEINVAT